MVIEDKKVISDIEIQVQKKQQVEYKLLGKHKPTIDGYNIFEYNLQTRELKKATFIESDIYYIDRPNVKKLVVNKDCLYIEALNLNNAIKRLVRGDFIYST